jgi:hypothetical protein
MELVIWLESISYEKTHQVFCDFFPFPITSDLLYLNFSHIHLHLSLAHNARRYLQHTREEEVIDTQWSELGQFSLSVSQLGLVSPPPSGGDAGMYPLKY